MPSFLFERFYFMGTRFSPAEWIKFGDYVFESRFSIVSRRHMCVCVCVR